MFERGIGYRDNHFIRGKSVRLYYNRAILTLGRIEQGTELFQGDLLVAKVNRRGGSARYADDLLIQLRTERETRERQRKRNTGLKDEIRTQEQKKQEQENNVDHRQHEQPSEVILLRPR